jgi:hypothetical protein
MQLTNEILNKIDELRELYPDAISIGYGPKISNGEVTGDSAIIYQLKEKKNITDLSLEEIIPSEIQVGDDVIKTDIVQIHVVNSLVCNVGCGEDNGSSSIPNRTYTRPIKGGLSITASNKYPERGTIGCLVKHTQSGAVVGLTNNHVTTQDAFYTSQRNQSGLLKNEYAPINVVYQNTEPNVPNSGDIIGQALRYVPIVQFGTGVNQVDAAIFSLSADVIDVDSSWDQVGLSLTQNPPFATTSEINNLYATNPQLYSSGRTTGPKGGSLCPLTIYQVGANTLINFDLQGVPTLCTFTNCIVFVKPDPATPTAQVPQCFSPIRPGDSGSLLLADIGGTIKVIGLNFAGGEDADGNTLYGYACRIDQVASQLGIEWWDNTEPLTVVDLTSIEYKTTVGGSSNKTLTCLTKEYWQVGFTGTLDNPC